MTIQRIAGLKVLTKEEIFRFVPSPQRKKLEKLAEKLVGKRIVHLNATAQGGGVAEILRSLIPYSNAFGVRSEWYAIDGTVGNRFFVITDKIRDGLQGRELKIELEEWTHYASVNKMITEELEQLSCDVLVVHDWQPAYAGFYFKNGPPKIFVSHADTSHAYHFVADPIIQAMKAYQRIVFSNKQFVYPRIGNQRNIRVIAPAIDPLVKKQTLLMKGEARKQLAEFGVFLDGPLIVQVSRFDRWKNPE